MQCHKGTVTRHSANIKQKDLRLRAKTLAESEHVTPPPEMDVTDLQYLPQTKQQKIKKIDSYKKSEGYVPA